ncbi:hypothetical protein HZS_4007 [Henneguya salminicola]|nr:hypothetical protein HZS_4007 [Henneguya salminicola]
MSQLYGPSREWAWRFKGATAILLKTFSSGYIFSLWIHASIDIPQHNKNCNLDPENYTSSAFNEEAVVSFPLSG